MSAHSCNNLCDLDVRFHRIQKDRHEALLMSEIEMKQYIHDRFIDLHPPAPCEHFTNESERECKDLKELLGKIF